VYRSAPKSEGVRLGGGGSRRRTAGLLEQHAQRFLAQSLAGLGQGRARRQPLKSEPRQVVPMLFLRTGCGGVSGRIMPGPARPVRAPHRVRMRHTGAVPVPSKRLKDDVDGAAIVHLADYVV
jgi:hypothetical protein